MKNLKLKSTEISYFNYEKAFSRNLGWVNEEEQRKIQSTIIAIPGMGGVGGHHLHSLLRVGFQNFKIADFDQFDIHNFNRQIGSNIDTVGRDKCAVMRDMALSINPNSKVEIFTQGVTDDNYIEFLSGVDILVDGLDIYQLDMRIKLFEHAHTSKIPVITAAPLGMGTSVLCFNPKGLSFNSYFNLSYSLDLYEKMARFLAGVSPKALQKKYLYHTKYVNLKEGKLPSLHMGCLSATSAMASICTKIAIGRGEIIWAPRGFQVDFYTNQYKKFWRPFGNRNPLQKLVIFVIKRILKKMDDKN